MPWTKINEIDQSRYLSVSNRAPLVALAPVIASFGSTTDAFIAGDEYTYNSIYGSPLTAPVQGDITRNYAITLINSGVTLLAKRIKPIVLKDGTLPGSKVIDETYNVQTLTSTLNDAGVYTVDGVGSIAVTAKYFGTRGNDVAFKFSKVNLSSGVLGGQSRTVYMIETYYVNNHNVTKGANDLYIGEFDNTMNDYTGVDSITLSTNPIDDNYIGNTNYLNTQLTNIDIAITMLTPKVENYTALLDALCELTTTNQAIMLVGGADYFTSKNPVTTEVAVTNEEFVPGTTTNTAHYPIVIGTFTATITAEVEEQPVTYNVTEDSATAGVITLKCDALTGFSGTLNSATGAIVLNGLPANATVTMNYTYTETTQDAFTPAEITAQFVDALSYQVPETDTNYPKTRNEFWEAFTDPYVYDFDAIVSCGFTGLSDVYVNPTYTSALHRNMLVLAVVRGDAVALLDTPKNWNYKDVYAYTEQTGGVDSKYSFGATHAPWCKMRDLSTGNFAMMPASLAFLSAIASGLLANGESSLWYAPAGVSRASCPNVTDVQYQVGGTILNYWQNDNIARVNPIMKILSYGYCVYGNATLMQNKQGYTKSSLQGLGTRFLCNSIKKAIFSICVRLTFEPNDYNLWSTFRTELGDVLRQYQLNGVIAEYSIQMDDSTVTNEDKQNLLVPGKVNIVPTLAAEYFDIDFTISAQGVTFAEQVMEEE